MGGWGQEPAAAEVKVEGKAASKGASEAEPLSRYTVLSPRPTVLGTIQSFEYVDNVSLLSPSNSRTFLLPPRETLAVSSQS